MSIESDVQALVLQTSQLDATFRTELVDTNRDVSLIRTRVTGIEIKLGLPATGSGTIPGGGGGSNTNPGNSLLGNDVIKIDAVGKLVWLWNPTTNSWVSVPFTAISPPVAIDVQSIINQANAGIDAGMPARMAALVASIQGTVLATQNTRIDGLAATLNTLGTTVSGNTAALQTEVSTRATGVSAVASSVTSLAAQVSSNHTAFTNFQAMVAADPTSASAVLLQQMQSNIAGNTAALATELSTRSAADSALSSQVSSLVTSVGAAQAAVQQEVTARSTGVNSVATSVFNLAARVGSTEGAITALQTVSAGSSGVTASQVNTLTTTVGNLSATVQDISSSVNGVSAKRSLAINANGQVTGIELLGGGTTGSQIKFQASSFLFYDPSTGVETVPFAVSGGVTTIKTAVIGDASIGTLKISGNAVIVPATQTRSDTVLSTGNIYASGYSEVMSQQITVPYACTLVILYQAKQDYANWNAIVGGGSTPIGNADFKGIIPSDTRILVNGSVVRSLGGDSVIDTVAVNHSIALSAGTHTVSVAWRGHRYDGAAYVNLNERNLTLIGAMR